MSRPNLPLSYLCNINLVKSSMWDAKLAIPIKQNLLVPYNY